MLAQTSTTTTLGDVAQQVTLSDSVWAVIFVPVAVIVIGAGAAAVVTVWQTLSDRRAAAAAAARTENAALFAAALDAVHEYQELPYRIRRRSDAPPMTREELTRHASNVQVLLDKHVTHLTFVDNRVGTAYRALVQATRSESGSHMANAWNEPRITDDKDMNLGNAYPRTQAEGAKEECVTTMQDFLDAPATRRRLRLGRR